MSSVPRPDAFEQFSAVFIKKFGAYVLPETLSSWAASGVPTNPHANLTRAQLAAALTAINLPITVNALGGLAHRGEGPPYALFGQHSVYRWGSSLAWAEARLGDPRARASELAAKRAERKAAWAAERAATAASYPTAAQ